MIYQCSAINLLLAHLLFITILIISSHQNPDNTAALLAWEGTGFENFAPKLVQISSPDVMILWHQMDVCSNPRRDSEFNANVNVSNHHRVFSMTETQQTHSISRTPFLTKLDLLLERRWDPVHPGSMCGPACGRATKFGLKETSWRFNSPRLIH